MAADDDAANVAALSLAATTMVLCQAKQGNLFNAGRTWCVVSATTCLRPVGDCVVEHSKDYHRCLGRVYLLLPTDGQAKPKADNDGSLARSAVTAGQDLVLF